MIEWLLTLQLQISLAVVAILLLRQVMKKMPKVYSYLLWLLVFARLLVPVSIESRFSFMPSEQERENLVGQVLELGEKDYTGESGVDIHGEDGVFDESIVGNVVDNKNMPTVPNGNMVADNLIAGSEHISAGKNPSAEVPGVNGTQDLDGNREVASDEVTGAVLFALWIAGAVTVLGVNGFALVRLQRFLSKGESVQRVEVTNLLTAREKSVPVYLSEKISTPFTLGLRKPVIYLPAGLTEGEKEYILCHEQVHITRKDNLVKHVTFFLTAVYWFNPFVWVAFFQMERDMEMSCDEKVLKLMGGDIKRNYSQSLLNFARGRGKMPATHLTFGENSVKQRVKNVLSYKNAKKWSIAIGAVVLVVVVVALFTTGRDDSAEGENSQDSAGTEAVDGQENVNDGSQSGSKDDLTSSLITDLRHVYPTVEEALNHHFETIMRENSNIVYPDYEYDEKAGKAVIRYFVNEGWERYVLLETVKVEKQEEFYYVEQESLKDYSVIETNTDFEALYGKPGLRNLNLLNYSESFYRYILQQLYTGSGSADYYAGFTDPVQAAVEMLNLGEGSGVAELKDGTVISGGGTGSVMVDIYLLEGTYAYVTYTFAKDGSTVEFPMRLIEGGYGLWSVDADAVREATQVQNYEWEPGLKERFGFSVEVSEYGVYRNENGVLTNIYPYYVRDSWYEKDGILYFPIDSRYQEGYYDYAVDTICMLDLVTGEFDRETLSLDSIPHTSAGAFRAVTVHDGYVYLAWDTMDYYMPLVNTGNTALATGYTYNGKPVKDLNEAEQDAYGAELRKEILSSGEPVKLSNRTLKETYAYVDLDGDGKAEKISLAAWAPSNDFVPRWTYDSFRLQAGDSLLTGQMPYMTNELTFFSFDGKNIVIALYGYDEHDESMAMLYTYHDGALKSLGEITCHWQNPVPDLEKGVLYATEYYNGFMQPVYLEKAYRINESGQLEEVPLDAYDVIYGKFEMPDLLVPLPVHETIGSGEVTYIQPQKVDFLKMDSSLQWVYLKAADGSEGWFRIEADIGPQGASVWIPELDMHHNRVFTLYYAG